MNSLNDTPKPVLTQKYLKECFHYDPDTGIFIWLERPRSYFDNNTLFKRWNSRFKGKSPNEVDKEGRIKIKVGKYPKK